MSYVLRGFLVCMDLLMCMSWQARAPLSLKFLDGKPIVIDPTSWSLVVKLAFKQQDGDKY